MQGIEEKNVIDPAQDDDDDENHQATQVVNAADKPEWLKKLRETAPLATGVVEGPVVESPVVESPVVESPVVESPVVESPVVESPVVESLHRYCNRPSFALAGLLLAVSAGTAYLARTTPATAETRTPPAPVVTKTNPKPVEVPAQIAGYMKHAFGHNEAVQCETLPADPKSIAARQAEIRGRFEA